MSSATIQLADNCNGKGKKADYNLSRAEERKQLMVILNSSSGDWDGGSNHSKESEDNDDEQ